MSIAVSILQPHFPIHTALADQAKAKRVSVRKQIFPQGRWTATAIVTGCSICFGFHDPTACHNALDIQLLEPEPSGRGSCRLDLHLNSSIRIGAVSLSRQPP